MISKDIKISAARSEVYKWCEETFGNGGESYNLIPGYRWTMYAYISGGLRVNFTNEEDYTWFMMRWG